MPNRTLKESICTSKRFNRLSREAQMLYLRIVVNCDDYGRFYGEQEIVRSRCYPYGNASEHEVNAALGELAEMGMVELYQHDDTTYMQLSAWLEHNTPRAKDSKHPGPDDSGSTRLHADVCKCTQMYANVSARARSEVDNEVVVDNEVESEVGAQNGAHGSPSDSLPDMTPLEEELAELDSWGEFSMDDRAWLDELLSDYKDALPRDVRDMRDYWHSRAEKDRKVKHSKGQWKQRFRTWLRRKAEYGGGNGNKPRGLPGNEYTGAFSDIETG